MLDLHIDKANSSAEHDIDLQYYLPNGEWELIGKSVRYCMISFRDPGVSQHFFLEGCETNGQL
jgi:hypothetical protein